MNFPQVITNPCLPTTGGPQPGGPVIDPRCSDPQFVIANPSLCQGQSALVIKPGVALACVLGSVQLEAFINTNGVETALVENSGVVFTSSNLAVALVGATSGNVTGVAPGICTITATYQGLMASCDLTILAGSGASCCGSVEVATVLVVDVSLSMSLQFGGIYPTKQDFADAIAQAYANQTDSNKGDVVGLVKFDTAPTTVDAVGTVPSKVATDADGLVNTQNFTGIGLALQQAATLLAATSANVKVIVLISDGEDKDTTAADAPLPIAEAFQQLGGVILCVGVRAHDAGFDLLNGLATGGFFVNAYPSNASDALQEVVSLKGYFCGGQCVPAGDTFTPKGQFNYTGFANWNVTQGCVDLKGDGFFDALPGNGLYVDMNGTVPCNPLQGQLTSKQQFAFVAGKTYRLSFSLAGNNTAPQTGDAINVTVGTLLNQTVNVPDYTQNFQTISFNFTPQVSMSANIVFTGITQGQTQYGVILDNIVLSDVTDLTQMFADNFDNENLTYVPPACGPSQGGAEGPNLIPPGVTYNAGGGGTANYVLTGLTIGATYTYQHDPQKSAGVQNVNNGGHLFTGDQNFVAAATSVTLSITFGGVGLTVEAVVALAFVPYYIGYNCYGYGCLTQPPGTQSPDPNPLQDIEGGGVGPGNFSSTQQACASCPTGSQNLADLVPAMTSDTAPSGVVSSSGTAQNYFDWKVFDHVASMTDGTSCPIVGWTSGTGLPQWVAYKMAQASIVTVYKVTNTANFLCNGLLEDVSGFIPVSWTFQGSQDGLTWTTLDTQTNVPWQVSQTPQTQAFGVNNTTAYLYYRLNITATKGSLTAARLLQLGMFGNGPQSQCATATATSTISQQDAVNKAKNAALSAATAELICQTVYTSHQTVTVFCPCGTFDSNFPNGATDSESATSFISQADADAKASLAACIKATAKLNCIGANNQQTITINDSPRFGSGAGQAPATPYPSVAFVSGLIGHITRIVVNLLGFAHTRPSDVFIVLVSPTGKTLVLMGNCGGSIGVSGVNLTFDSQGNPPSLPQNTQINSGTYAPTLFGVGQLYNCTNVSGCPPGSPSSFPSGPPYGTTFAGAGMIGDTPNGSWSLWVVDLLALDAGQIQGGWTINITSA